MLRRSLLAVLVLTVLCAAAAKQVDNSEYRSWARFKPSSSASYREVAGKTERRFSVTLLEVTPAEVVLEEVTHESVGTPWPLNKPQKHRLPAKADDYGKPALTEKVIREEEITVDGRKLKCKVTEVPDGMDGIRFLVRVWRCDEVPGAVVRLQFICEEHHQYDVDRTLERFHVAESRSPWIARSSPSPLT